MYFNGFEFKFLLSKSSHLNLKKISAHGTYIKN